MTDRPRRRSRALPVYAVTSATFVAGSAALGAQMLTGHDPALGVAPSAAPTAQAAPAAVRRRVLVRRIERTIVVTHLLPPRASGPAAGGGATAAPAPGGGRVVAPAAPAVIAPSAPAPAAAPAPAPAPAPVTRSS